MAGAALRAQLNALLASMFATGTVDEHFQQLQSLQKDGFVAEVANLFLDGANRILNDIDSLLDQPVVNFDKVDALVHQLRGCSSR